jgi:hypothetical protein
MNISQTKKNDLFVSPAPQGGALTGQSGSRPPTGASLHS